MKIESLYVEGEQDFLEVIISLARNALGDKVNAITINPKLQEEQDNISTIKCPSCQELGGEHKDDCKMFAKIEDGVKE